MLEKIFEKVWSNLKNPKLYVFLLILIIVVVLFFPYIDANVFYYQRITNRVEIVEKVANLDIEKIESNEILKQEYNSILQEINKQKDGSLGSVFAKTINPKENLIKFITGDALFWVLALCCPFIKTFKSRKDSFLGLLIVGGIGFVFAAIAKALPTVFNPWVNYIGFPLILLILAGILATSQSKAKK